MDYVTPGRRKTKGDKRAKSRYNRYKKGGSQRVVKRENNQDSEKKKKGARK